MDLPNRLISSHAPELGGSGEVTLEFWMTNTGSQNWARFFDFGSSVGAEVTGPGGGGEGFDYLTVTASVGTDVGRSLLSLRTHDIAAGNGPLGVGGPDFQQENNYPTGTFTTERHVAVIWRDGKFLELYENGVPFREVRGNNGLTGLNGVKMVQLNDVNCWLGRSNWTGDSNLAGTINEFRVYDRALTPGELLKNETDGPAATLPGPQDTDGDGLPNWFERQYASATMDYQVAGSPLRRPLDGDTDGLTNLQEYQRGLNPIVADTDGDGLNDGAEITAGTDPLLTDTDGDGLTDGAEVNTHHSNPLVVDTDGDGYTDSQEVAGGSNPTNPTSIPVVFLAARYSFNDAAGPAAAGSVVVDSVSGLNGYIRGDNATWTGNSVQLPGPGTDPAYVDLPNRLISRFAKSRGGRGAVTLEGWVTVTTHTGAGWQRILDFGSTAPGSTLGEVFGPARTTFGDISGQDYIFLSGARGDTIEQRRIDWTNNDRAGGAGGSFGADFDATANTIDTEFHFAVTIDENTGLLKYYENGVEIVSPQGTLKLDALNDVNCWLGRSNWTADGAFQGSYNEFRVYAGTLSASDVAKSMAKGPTATAQGTNPTTDITTLKVLNANGWPEWWIDRNGGVLPAANSDSDGDGLTALQELGRGSDPTKADTDGDGLSDAVENNSGVFVGATSTGTDPANPDTDSDGLRDDAEVAAGTNPFDQDSDKDLAFDGADAQPTNPVASSLTPAHRWTFDNLGADTVPSGTVVPDVAGGDAFPAIIKGLNASTDGSSIILGGGANNEDSAYVDLPNGLISSQTRITMAGWVKVSAITNWSRIVDFGSSNNAEVPPGGIGNGNEYLFYSASNGTNPSEQRLALKDDPGGESLYNIAYTTPDTETFFAFTIDSTSGDRSVYNLYREGVWGIRFSNAFYALKDINDVNNWLGRSQYAGDPQLNGSFNEFRIYNGTLNERAIRSLHATGPNDILDLYSATRSGNQLTLQFESRETLNYTVESSPDLATWTPVSTGVPGEAGMDSTTVNVPMTAGRLYYRIRLDD